MTPDVLTADPEEEIHASPQLQRKESDRVLEPSSTVIDVSDMTSTPAFHRLWAMDDAESLVLDVFDEIVSTSIQQVMGNLMNRRLFGYVAAWSVAIIQECLQSAIAPTGDAGVDVDNCTAIDHFENLLGRAETPLEILEPPKRCSLDYSYQRGQLPIKAGRLDNYDSESLHSAVKAATRSRKYSASIASSRVTTKSRIRRKQQDANAGHAAPTGPQPGVPFSAEAPQSKDHTVSPRKVLSIRRTSTPDDVRLNEIAAPGLQLDIDTGALHPGSAVNNTRTHESPPPLSRSPVSTTSSRRRLQPPRSAQNGRNDNMIVFGEKEDEVQVEYTVQKSSPERSSAKSRSVLPNLDRSKSTARLKMSSTAFGAFSGSVDTFSVDRLDQEFHSMPLSPGVKLRAGKESITGPDLPPFAAHMRRSTFTRMETCSLTTPGTNLMLSPKLTSSEPQHQHQAQQGGKATFLTERSWGLNSSKSDSKQEHTTNPAIDKSSTGNMWTSRKSEAPSHAAPVDSCMCNSPSSLTLFRKQGKVERPCRNCRGIHTDSEPMDFTNLVKQRAFHQKPPSLPTSSSPSKRAPGTSPRRVTSAPACSPLARRNLLFSKKTQPNNTCVESATSIL